MTAISVLPETNTKPKKYLEKGEKHPAIKPPGSVQ